MARPRSVSAASLPAAVRVHFGLSQQQLAGWLGMSVGFVGALETGRSPLPAEPAPVVLPALPLSAPDGLGRPAPLRAALTGNRKRKAPRALRRGFFRARPRSPGAGF